MRLRTLLLASGALLLALACDKKKEEPTPPAPVTPKIEIPSESQAVFSQGISIQAGTSAQSQTVKFSTTAAWSADVADTKASTWLSVQPTSGSAGTVNMTVTAQPNTGAEDREASVTIKCGTVTQKFTVKQAGNPSATVAVESVSLDKTELTLEPGKSETLNATVKPDNATDKTVTWSTSDANVATVDNGKVTAIKEGEASIIATASGKSAVCKVKVQKVDLAVEAISLNKTELILVEGADETLIATVTPENATDKTVTWSTSNVEIATVADGKVTAVKKGEATITAKAGEKEATCIVTVTASEEVPFSVSPTSVEMPVEGGTFDVTVTCSTTYHLTSMPDWVTEKAVNGKVHTFEVSANTSTEQRSGVIVFCDDEGTCVPCNIKQSGVEASFSLSPTSVEIESSGGTFNVTVTCSTNYHLDSKPDWVTEKSVEGKVHTFEVSANTSTAQRSGVIVFCDDMGTCLPCNIRQAGTASISLSVDKPSLSFSYSSGSNLLSITSNTEWSVVPSQSWCHSSYTSGSGNAQITISVDPNDSENARSEVLTICSADNTVAVYVSIMQEGKPASTDFDWTKNFYHQALFMRFTATWCGWCPRMNKSVHEAQERYPNKIIHLAIHGSGSALEFSKTDLLAYQYQISGFPAGIVDGRDRIYNEEVNVVVPKIIYDVQETEKTFGTKTGLSIESSVAGRSVEINIGAYIKKAGSYKVSVFLVEDGIVSSQTDYEEGDKPNYVHDGVARIAVSDARGDDFSVVSDYSLKKFSYTVNVPSEYKLENMRVLAYIQASYSSEYTGVLYYGNYYVDNCATSQLGKTLAVQVDDRVSGGGNEGIDIGDIITF